MYSNFELEAEIYRLRGIIAEIHSWIVCSCITTAEDMAQNFPRILEITDPTFKGHSEDL